MLPWVGGTTCCYEANSLGHLSIADITLEQLFSHSLFTHQLVLPLPHLRLVFMKKYIAKGMSHNLSPVF